MSIPFKPAPSESSSALSGLRVGVRGTCTFLVQVSVSKAKGDGSDSDVAGVALSQAT
jgi:hypothetical protein